MKIKDLIEELQKLNPESDLEFQCGFEAWCDSCEDNAWFETELIIDGIDNTPPRIRLATR